jgi:hypothetical protein
MTSTSNGGAGDAGQPAFWHHRAALLAIACDVG